MSRCGAPCPDALDLALIDSLQHGLSLANRPFRPLALQLGLGEAEIVVRLGALLRAGVLSRFGPMYDVARMGGSFVLAALAVPPARWDAVVAAVNALPEVAHNYAREHSLNMWFVLATETPAAAAAALARIRATTGLAVYAFPKEREYTVGLRLPLNAAPSALRRPVPRRALSASIASCASRQADLAPLDRRIVCASQAGLPLQREPYAQLARTLEIAPALVLERLRAMHADGRLRRVAAVPNHYALGFGANGMAVWDVDDVEVDALGARLAAQPGVSHCYRRPRRLPRWRYNLFAMVHGRSRAEVCAEVARLDALLGRARRAHALLFSSAILKKTGLRLPEASPGALL